MSNLMRFMMTIIALVLLSYLNSESSQEIRGEATRSLAISPGYKFPG